MSAKSEGGFAKDCTYWLKIHAMVVVEVEIALKN
jgi:hypothetical protein